MKYSLFKGFLYVNFYFNFYRIEENTKVEFERPHTDKPTRIFRHKDPNKSKERQTEEIKSDKPVEEIINQAL